MIEFDFEDKGNGIKKVKRQIFHEGEVIYKVYPDSCPFVNGLAVSYSTKYNKEKLGQYIDEKKFQRSIRQLNDVLITFWPWDICFFGCGFLFGFLTWGLTCLLPYSCIKDAKEQMFVELDTINREYYNPRGLSIEYKSCVYSSYFEIRKIIIDEELQIDEHSITDEKIKDILPS